MNFSNQVEMVTLDQLVPSDHIYRKFKDLWDLSEIKSELEDLGLKYTDEDWFNLVSKKLAETEPVRKKFIKNLNYNLFYFLILNIPIK